MAGRFNKILEFIGLVDDEPEEEQDQGRRPVGGQTYGAQTRRAAPPSAPRPSYEEPKSRYSSARPEYDARARRAESAGPRYGEYSRGSTGSTPPRGDYASSRGDYASGRGEYASGRGEYGATKEYAPPRSSQRDPFEDAFDRDQRGKQPREQQSVVPLRGPAPSHQTVIYYLRQLEECRDVINDLLDNKTVLLNLEDMDERVVQRGIDTLCGAAFALGATLRKASDKTYLIAPKSVEVASTNDQERRF